MAFVALSVVAGNRISTAGVEVRCAVAECIQVTQTRTATLVVPAAPVADGGAAGFARTAILVRQVLASCARAGVVEVVFRPGAAGPPVGAVVRCAVLRARSTVVARSRHVWVAYAYRAELEWCAGAARGRACADSEPLVAHFLVDDCGDHGTWEAKIDGRCLRCVAAARTPTGGRGP